GRVNRNDFGLVNAMHHLPFGGVGASGMGNHHGTFGFDTFSHHRPPAAPPTPLSLASPIPTPHSPRTAKDAQRHAERQPKAAAKRLGRQSRRTMAHRSWTAADLPSLEGRTAVVTGANSGLGLVTARRLAAARAHVVLAVRDRDRGNQAAAGITGAT